MKNSWTRLGLLVLMLTALLITGCGKKNQSNSTANNEFKAGDITVKVGDGAVSTAKFGRYTEIQSEITNDGKDFSGMLQAVILVGSEKMMYRKTINVAAGETKNISMIVPVCSGGNNVVILQLCNDSGEKLGETKFRQSVVTSGDINLGIVGKNAESLGYFGQENIKIFTLENGIADDFRAMDSLDVLLINRESTEELTENQIAAVVNFVDKGGTLVLGTGEGGEKVLSAFSGTMLNGKVGGTKNIKTSLGITKNDIDDVQERAVETEEQKRIDDVKKFVSDNISPDLYGRYSDPIEWLEDNSEILAENGEIYEYLSKKFDADTLTQKLDYNLTAEEKKAIEDSIVIKDIEKTVLQLEIEGAQTVLSDGDTELIQKLPYGQGNILISSVDLSLDNDMWYSIGNVLANLLENNLSTTKKKQMSGEQGGDASAGTSFINALNLTENRDLPNTFLYAFILVIYILLIGPVLYIIFRKKDIRQYLWGAIPCCAVIFALMIYFIGMGTRIQKPKISYISIVEVGEGDNLDAVPRKNYFGVMVPDNKGSVMEMAGNADITPLMSDGYYDYYDYNTDAENDSGYRYGIEYGTDHTSILLENMSAFSSVYLRQNDNVKVEGTVEGNISYNNFVISGSVTNNSKKDMTGAMLYTDGFVYPLGDLPAGKSKSLDGIKSIYMPVGAYMDRERPLKQLTGYSVWDMAPKDEKKYRKYREAYALEAFFSGKSDFEAGQCYVIGFVDDNSFADDVDYEASGISVYCHELSVKLDDANTIISDLSEYDKANLNGGNYDSDGISYKEKVTAVYAFDKSLELVALWYMGKDADKYFDWLDAFDGKVYIQNQKTGEDEVIFDKGDAGNFALTEDYVTENNEVVLTYESKSSDEWALPRLRVTANK